MSRAKRETSSPCCISRCMEDALLLEKAACTRGRDFFLKTGGFYAQQPNLSCITEKECVKEGNEILLLFVYLHIKRFFLSYKHKKQSKPLTGLPRRL